MAVTVNALFKKSAPAPAKTVKKTVRSVVFFLLFYESKFLFIHSPARIINLFFTNRPRRRRRSRRRSQLRRRKPRWRWRRRSRRPLRSSRRWKPRTCPSGTVSIKTRSTNNMSFPKSSSSRVSVVEKRKRYKRKRRSLWPKLDLFLVFFLGRFSFFGFCHRFGLVFHPHEKKRRKISLLKSGLDTLNLFISDICVSSQSARVKTRASHFANCFARARELERLRRNLFFS